MDRRSSSPSSLNITIDSNIDKEQIENEGALARRKVPPQLEFAMKIGNANPVIAGLRERIEHLEGAVARQKSVLPFGVDDIDDCLPGGGLSYGAIHEFADGGTGTVDGAAAALFAAGIAARTKGKIVWCLTRPDLFFPALAQAGLHHNRVVFVEADKEEDVLASLEEGLSFGGLGAVVGELVRLPMTASRRLQLAAERTGTIGLIVRRWRRQTEASDFGQPTASTTRWRVTSSPRNIAYIQELFVAICVDALPLQSKHVSQPRH
jgi:protein ImuA